MNAVTKALLSWYKKNHRALPWREDPTPYHVWLSEIMLQQTRVEAVKAYYLRFIEEVPDIAHLAGLDETRLYKLWEGLGYYSRAKNLRKAARIVTEEYGGRLPEEAAQLRTLPGIGAYTAAAVSSIAFAKREAAVDGNVLRVMARLRADERDIAQEKTKRAVQKEIEEHFLPAPGKDCGTFNQAMMELGATVCVPNGAPLCADCPLQSLCVACQAGTQEAYPKKTKKKARRIENKTVLLICDREAVLLRRRPEKGLLAGLYEYPSFSGHLSEDEVRSFLQRERIRALRVIALPDAKHIFTHVEWHMKGFMVYTGEKETKNLHPAAWEGVFAADKKDLRDVYAVPGAFRAFTARLLEEGVMY